MAKDTTRVNKERVIAFRVPATDGKELDKRVRESRIVGVRSPHQMARKIVRDFIAGHLIYVNGNDKLVEVAGVPAEA